MRLRIDVQEKRLDNLFEMVSKCPEDEIKSHLAKYLCIQASGYLENVVKELVSDYHENSCKKATASFVNNKMKYFTNVDDRKLSDFLTSFNDGWEKQFHSKVSERHISSLESIISQRNKIAHGDAGNSNIIFANMVQYYKDLKEIIVILRTVIHKNN